MAAFPKIISGGQTGADRAGLDFAILNGIAHGGWCPAGRRAEDGRISAKYELRETPSEEYLQRTEWNVRDSDATVIFTRGPLEESEGSLRTAEFAQQFGKPFVHLRPGPDAAERLFTLLAERQPQVLNVAGSRGDGTGGIEKFVTEVLATVWKDGVTDPQGGGRRTTRRSSFGGRAVRRG